MESSIPSTIKFIVSNSALVDARGGGIGAGNIWNLSGVSPTDGSVGIVFGHDRSDSKAGTVYGDVTLQEDLEIGEGESLTIPDGASLDTNGNTITVASGGKLEGRPTGSGMVKIAPTITTESLPDGEVGTVYSQTLIATGDSTITWSVTSGTLPAGLTLDTSTGVISGTPTTDGTFTFTVKAENSVGNDSKKYELTIDPKPTVTVTGVKLDQTKLPLYTGESKTLTATVAPDNATNKTVTWSSNNEAVATVDQNGTVTAKSAGTAIITVTTTDGEKTATCTVTVTDKTYTISADPTALNFGSVYTGYTQPAAQTVTLTNTGNQQVTVTLPTANDFIITAGTGFTDGSAAIKPGEAATFTVQPKAGLSAGTYSDTITVSDTNNNVTVTIPASFTVKSRLSYNPPTVSEETTDAIKAADPG